MTAVLARYEVTLLASDRDLAMPSYLLRGINGFLRGLRSCEQSLNEQLPEGFEAKILGNDDLPWSGA